TGTSILDSRLLIPFEDTGPIPRLAELVDDHPEIGRLLLNRILYDRLVIPTVDFAVVPLLALWVGPSNLISALRRRRIQLARYRGSIGYIGGGHGLEMFEV